MTDGAGVSFPEKIFRAYDIRGIAGDTVTETLSYAIGGAFAGKLKEAGAFSPSVAVAYDCRLSSPSLCAALCEGLRAGGATVIQAGLLPTPALYYAVKYFTADGGIMITGSHNPKDHNGFKITDAALAWHTANIAGLRPAAEMFLSARPYAPEADAEAPAVHAEAERFLNAYLSRLTAAAFTAPCPENLKIAWDPGHGAAAAVLPTLLKRLPGEHILLNGVCDGRFPDHHPDPGVPENMRRLQETVLNEGCDAGFAFDGDGDRIGVVDETGTIAQGDRLSYMFASDYVRRADSGKTPLIVADVKTGARFFSALRAQGADTLMWKTGHSLIKEKMAETGAVFGGEASGHMFFSDQYGFDDAIFAALRFLDIMRRERASASALLNRLPEGARSPEWRLEVGDDEKFRLLEKMTAKLRREGRAFCDIDGIRIDNGDSWTVLRVSNTQPAVVAAAEAQDAAGLRALTETLDADLRDCGYDLRLAERLDNNA